MRFNILKCSMAAWLCFQLILPHTLSAMEIAPRISDREIIEKLTALEAGQKHLEAGQKYLTEKISVLETGQKSLSEKIAVSETGQKALRAEMKAGQEALRAEMKVSSDAINKRLDDYNSTMLVLFASLITLIVALFGYIAWDRRTMVKPVIEQVNRLERKVHDDLDLNHSDGSLLRRQLQALRLYAGKNPEFAEILRGLALL